MFEDFSGAFGGLKFENGRREHPDNLTPSPCGGAPRSRSRNLCETEAVLSQHLHDHFYQLKGVTLSNVQAEAARFCQVRNIAGDVDHEEVAKRFLRRRQKSAASHARSRRKEKALSQPTLSEQPSQIRFPTPPDLPGPTIPLHHRLDGRLDFRVCENCAMYRARCVEFAQLNERLQLDIDLLHARLSLAMCTPQDVQNLVRDRQELAAARERIRMLEAQLDSVAQGCNPHCEASAPSTYDDTEAFPSPGYDSTLLQSPLPKPQPHTGDIFVTAAALTQCAGGQLQAYEPVFAAQPPHLLFTADDLAMLSLQSPEPQSDTPEPQSDTSPLPTVPDLFSAYATCLESGAHSSSPDELLLQQAHCPSRSLSNSNPLFGAVSREQLQHLSRSVSNVLHKSGAVHQKTFSQSSEDLFGSRNNLLPSRSSKT